MGQHLSVLSSDGPAGVALAVVVGVTLLAIRPTLGRAPDRDRGEGTASLMPPR